MATPDGLQVQGLCRFSYPCTGGFKKHHDSLSDRRAALYDPRRLDRRLAWFTHVALPGLAAQTDAAFTLHVLVGEDLPEPWRSRLEAAIRPLPQIRLHALPPLDHRAPAGRSCSAPATARWPMSRSSGSTMMTPSP